MNFQHQIEVPEVSAQVGAKTTVIWYALRDLWGKRLERRDRQMHEEYEHLFTYVREVNGIVKSALEALSSYDRERAVELAAEFNTLAKKSLYDAFWRADAEKEHSDGIK